MGGYLDLIYSGRYNFIIYFFLVRAGIVYCYLYARFETQIQFSHKLSPALLMSKTENIPTSTGNHHGSWTAVILLFKFIIHKRRTAWWRNYNLILALALKRGVAMAAIIVYFTIYYTGTWENYVSSVLLSSLLVTT